MLALLRNRPSILQNLQAVLTLMALVAAASCAEKPAAPQLTTTAGLDAAAGDAAGTLDAADDATAATAADAAADAPDDAQVGQDGTVSPVPSGKSACDSDDDCAGAAEGKKCQADIHVCVQCLTSKDCAPGDLCQASQCQAAKTCKSDTDCKAANQVCDKAATACVDCVADVDCADGGKCVDHHCAAAKVCKSSKDCPAVCDQQKGLCVQCLAATDCGEGQACIQGNCLAKICSGPVCAGGKSFACLDGGGYAPGKSCDDGNGCTEGDGCSAGICQPGPAKTCDDGNLCTTDSCDPKLGCQAVFNTVACDDGDACTEVDSCGAGVCTGKNKFCDDGQNCTADKCQGGTCVNAPTGGNCTDGTACTQDDACEGGKCKPGAALKCDDQNPCTDDSCNPASGCVYAQKTGSCDDGNNCTQSDTCTAGKCVGIGKQCDDGNLCTDDKCDSGICSFVQNSKTCDDGDNCTDKDACVQGKCAGTKKNCNDNNACTDDACLSTGCAHFPKSGTCDDGNGCTENDTCTEGSCSGSPKTCNDNNPCTADKCESGKCAYTNSDGGPCGSGCDVCKGGTCQIDPNPGLEDGYGTIYNDSLRVVLPAPNNGWLLAGRRPANGNSYDEGWVVRVDAKGAVLWEKSYGSSYTDSFRAGIVAADGSYVLTGTYYSSSKGYQMWLLRIDDSGAVKTDVTFGSSATESGAAIAANGAGYLVAGQMTTSSSSSTYNYAYLVQADPNGGLLWEKTFSNILEFTAVLPVDDQIVVAGTGYKSGAGNEAMVLRIKSGGSVVWTAFVGGTYNEWATGMIDFGGGQLVLTGLQGSSQGNLQMAASIKAADGSVAWQKSYGISGSTTTGAALAKVGNSVVLVGQAVKTNGYGDGLLTGIAPADGTMLWQRTAPGPTYASDALWGIHPRASGGFAAVGERAVTNAGTDGWLLLLTADGKLGCQCEAGCSDNNACTIDFCVLGLCNSTNAAKDSLCTDAAQMPGKCDAAGKCMSTCGNKYCDAGESNLNCPADCKPPTVHPCNNSCGSKNATYGCYCDSKCVSQGDCCTSTGATGSKCAGSTCSYCN